MHIPRKEEEIVKRTVSRNDDFRVLQHNIKRPEGIDKVTGKAIYIDDFQTEKHLYGKTIRSTIAHGILKNIHFKEGIPWDEFVIVTAKDIPGKNMVTMLAEDQPFLCEHEIMHKAEPLALIAHKDKHLVEKALHFVDVEVETLPAIFSIEESEQNKVTLKQGNLSNEFHVGLKEISDEVWAECDQIVEGTYETGAQEQLYIETQGIISQVDFDGDAIKKINVWGSMQCPFYIVKALKPLFDVDDTQVRVVQTETGGGFGGKEEYPSILSGHAALLSWKAGGRPVRMIYDRQEDLWATTKRHPSKITIKIGLKSDGTLHAMDIDLNLNAGGYVTLTPLVLSRALLHAWGPYRCPNTSAHARSWLTNSNPFGAFRGFGTPQAVFAMELHINKCAAELNLDPAELRRKNLLQFGDTMPTGQVIDEQIDLDFLLDRSLEKSDYVNRRQLIEQFNQEQKSNGGLKRRGIGLCMNFHGGTFAGSGETHMNSHVAMTLNAKGHVDILAGQVEYGQGTITTFVQIASEVLGIPVEWISKHQPDTDVVPDSGPTVASRTTIVVGKMVERCSQALLGKLSEVGLKKDYTAEEFRHAAKKHHDQHNESLYVKVKFEAPPDQLEWNEETYEGAAYAAYTWKCDILEVEVDLVDYSAKCDKFISVVECGRVLNPIIAVGQIEGGNAQALGFGLYEDTVLQEGGMVNNQYTNYIIPTTADIPEMEVEFIEFPYLDYGPYAAKGIGELPIDAPAAAVAAAVAHALGNHFICDIPILPEKIMAMAEQVEGI